MTDDMTPYTLCRALADRLGMRDPSPRELFAAVVAHLPGPVVVPSRAAKGSPPIDVDAVVDALIRRRLDRGLLLSWLPHGVAGSLPVHQTPAAQYRSDVLSLCETPEHLTAYLRQAERLTGPFAEAGIFRSACVRLVGEPVRSPGLSTEEVDQLCSLAMRRNDAEGVVRLVAKWGDLDDRSGPRRWRAALKQSLPMGFVYSLPSVSRPIDQVRFDIMELQRTPRLIGVEGRPMDRALHAFADAIPDADRGQFADDVRCVLTGAGR